MSKICIIERENKKKKLIEKYSTKWHQFKSCLKETNILKESFKIFEKMQNLPKNSIKIRSRNRCWRTGRSRGYSRVFGLCRHFLREMGHQGILPGVIKSS